jgi:Ferritin-like domain
MTDKHHADRRSFLKTGAIAGTALVAGQSGALAQLDADTEASNLPLKRGDAAILRFLAAAELLETDLWQQYNELGGIQDSEVPGGSGSPAYTAALNNLDEDMSQYIHDNTDDEMTHAAFINAFLVSRGARPVNLEPFRTLPGSQATGADTTKKRLTNLMQLTVDTSWWTRYRDSAHNPDLDPSFMFPQAVPSLNSGQHPAIPRTDADLTPANHIQAIANTAAFHFALIEQGGTSLYPSLAQRVTGINVLRILLSIGPTETMHFQTWQDRRATRFHLPWLL